MKCSDCATPIPEGALNFVTSGFTFRCAPCEAIARALAIEEVAGRRYYARVITERREAYATPHPRGSVQVEALQEVP